MPVVRGLCCSPPLYCRTPTPLRRTMYVMCVVSLLQGCRGCGAVPHGQPRPLVDHPAIQPKKRRVLRLFHGPGDCGVDGGGQVQGKGLRVIGGNVGDGAEARKSARDAGRQVSFFFFFAVCPLECPCRGWWFLRHTCMEIVFQFHYVMCVVVCDVCTIWCFGLWPYLDVAGAG